MRISKTFVPNDVSFDQRLLQWASGKQTSCLLDSNNFRPYFRDRYSAFDFVCAVDSLKELEIETNDRKNAFQKLKEFVEWMNQKGVPVPIAREKGRPSVSFSLLIVSALFVALSLIDPIVHLGISFWESLAWFGTCATLYMNRTAKISKDGVEFSASEEKKD